MYNAENAQRGCRRKDRLRTGAPARMIDATGGASRERLRFAAGSPCSRHGNAVDLRGDASPL